MAKQKFTNEDDFLKNLEMVSMVEPFNKFNTPRIAQLTQRSNQFNLRTIRYSESEIEKLSLSEDYIGLTFTLKDKFGEHGLISVIILQKEDQQTLFIDTWVMSCRVLKRGMENFVLNSIVQEARQKGFEYLKGEYLPTPKNGIVKSLYSNLGFKKIENYFLLDLTSYSNKKSHIKLKATIYE